jgi:hypothetical protein
MTTFPGSPRLIRGGIVRVDPASGALVGPIIALQYTPDTMTRTLQMQPTGGEGGDRSEPLRLKGPAVETIKVEAEIDLTDQLEFPDQHPNAVQLGLHPYLSVLESMVHPTTGQLETNQQLASAGTLEILPMEAPLTLFIWSRQRIVPVRLTEFSITEEAFDPALNPIRAKASLGMRVLSVTDLGFEHRGGTLFMNYLRQKEQLAAKYEGAAFGALGVKGV